MTRSSVEKEKAVTRAQSRHKQAPAVAQVPAIAAPSATTATTRSRASTDASAAKEWTCDDCGKSFAKKASLKGHCGATGHPFPNHYRAIVKAPPWDEPEDDYDYDEDLAYDDYPEPTEQDEDGDIPDPFIALKRELVLYGMQPKRALQFCTLMKHKNVNELADLFEVADRLGWRPDQRNWFLESWANSRGLSIPNWVADEMDTPVYPRRSARRGREGLGGEQDSGYYRAKSEFLESRIQDGDSGARESDRVLERAMQQLEDANKAMLRERELHHDALERERDRRHEIEIKSMEERHTTQMHTQTLSGEQAAWSQINKSLDRIGNTSAMTMKWLITGIMEGDKAPDRERGEPSSVADMMYETAPEYVED